MSVGTGELQDHENHFKNLGVIYSDEEPDKINSLPDSADHRVVDLKILKAKKELGDKAKISIIMPPCIWGIGESPFNKHSQQVVAHEKAALKSGVVPCVGDGAHYWSYVHIKDLVPGYITILVRLTLFFLYPCSWQSRNTCSLPLHPTQISITLTTSASPSNSHGSKLLKSSKSSYQVSTPYAQPKDQASSKMLLYQPCLLNLALVLSDFASWVGSQSGTRRTSSLRLEESWRCSKHRARRATRGRTSSKATELL